jgi:transposase
VREQREFVRCRRKLSQLRAGLKAQVHAVIGKEGLVPPVAHLWGPGGKDWLDDTQMADAFEDRLRSLRRLIKTYDAEIVRLDARIAEVFKGHAGNETIMQIHGIGPVFAGIFCAEIGDINQVRDRPPAHLLGGDDPPPSESDTKVQRGSITKQGPRLVRWAAVEAVSRNHAISPVKDLYVRVGQRRGVNKGRVAAARKLLTLVFYGMRDLEVRCLDIAHPTTEAA